MFQQQLKRTLATCGLALGLLTATAMVSTAHAGRTCETKPISVVALQKGLGLAERTVRKMDETGAKVVLLARVGQDLRSHGLHYSHFGLAYRDDGVWRVVHKLNQCGSDRSALYRQGIGDFFMDTPFDYEAGVVVPSPQMQDRLWAMLKEGKGLRTMHTRNYSMVAYAWAHAYQQSNQWALETMALAMEPGATTRDRAQAWLRFKGYEPTELHLSAMTRLGARMTAANVSFDDHPNNLRYSGRIRTVTVESVFDWMGRAGLGEALLVVR